MTMLPQCLKCKHLFPLTLGQLMRCSAFPEEIPHEIRRNQHDHRKPFSGDNGIRFRPVAKAEAAKKTKAK